MLGFGFFLSLQKVLALQTSLEDVKSWLAKGGSKILQSGLSIMSPFVIFKYDHTILYTAKCWDVLY